MSNRRKLPEPGRRGRRPAAGQQQYQASRDRMPPRPVAFSAAVPGHVGTWLLAAGALGAVAVAGLHAGTRAAPADNVQGTGAQTATLTADAGPAPSLFAPGTTPSPGLTGTQSGPAPWAPIPNQPFPNVTVPAVIDPSPPNLFQTIFPAVGISGNYYKLGPGFSLGVAADTQFLPQNGISFMGGVGVGTGGADVKVSGYNTTVSTNSGFYLSWQVAVPSTATTAPPDALMPSPFGFVPPLPVDFAIPGADASLPPDAIQLSKVSGVVPLLTTNDGFLPVNPTFSATFAYKDPAIPFGLQPQVTANIAPFKGSGGDTVGDDLSASTGFISTSEAVKAGGSISSATLSGKLFISYQTLMTWFDSVMQGNLLNAAAQGGRIDPEAVIKEFPTDPQGVLDKYFPSIGIIPAPQPGEGVDPIPFVDVSSAPGGAAGSAGSIGSVTTTDPVTGAQYTIQGVGPFTSVPADQWYSLLGQLPSQANPYSSLDFLPQGWTPTPPPPALTLSDRIGGWLDNLGSFLPPLTDSLGNPLPGLGASLDSQPGSTQTASGLATQQDQQASGGQLAQNAATPASSPAPVQAGAGDDAFAAAPYVANPLPPSGSQPATGNGTQVAATDWPQQAPAAPATTGTPVVNSTTTASLDPPANDDTSGGTPQGQTYDTASNDYQSSDYTGA